MGLYIKKKGGGFLQGQAGLQPYISVLKPSREELVIQRSRFIGRCFPVKTQEEALAILNGLRKEHWDATHNCYAYSIGIGGSCARFSDDGEPGGTAGMPMMECIKKKGVTDVLCVVTRYFGGILLGAGGLVRAYSKSCSQSIEAAGLVRMAPGVRYSFDIPYRQWDGFLQLCGHFAPPEQIEYQESIRCLLMLPKEQEQHFLQTLREKTNNSLQGRLLGEAYLPFPL